MQEKYKVIEIFERDYGCEEREEGQADMVQVRICSESGQERVIEAEDAALYREEITEGTEVFLIDGKLKRALKSIWDCTGISVGTPPGLCGAADEHIKRVLCCA